MAFLLNNEQTFTVVDSNPRQGIFCQFYNQNGFSRPIQIQPTVHSNYSATLDSSNSLHIVSQNNKNQVSHFSYLNGHYTRRIILEDPSEIYKFSNLSLHYFNNALHLFYVACTPVGSSYALIHQILDTDKIETLLKIPSPNINLKVFNSNDFIYVFYVENNISFTLKCIILSKQDVNYLDVITSSLPIKDYSICFANDNFHIVYEKEMYGKYQLFYTNNISHTEQLITSNVTPCVPSIFFYANGVWINYLEGNKLKTRLSMDQGKLFSLPVNCGLQENVSRYTYYSLTPSSLNANLLYATSSNFLRLATISAIDIDGIHPDIKHNIELELLLEGMSLASTPLSSTNTSALLEENLALKEAVTKLSSLNKQLTKQLNKHDSQPILDSAPTPAPKSSIQSAATAFMQEMNQWDLPPNN